MIILDTNVLSELMRPDPNSAVVAWIGKQSTGELLTTTITEGEILYGIELLARGKRRERLLAAAGAMFNDDLSGQVLPFDSAAARAFAKIAAHRRSLGKPISHADAQIAAIAQVRRARVATRDTSDFEGCGIEVVDPWTES